MSKIFPLALVCNPAGYALPKVVPEGRAPAWTAKCNRQLTVLWLELLWETLQMLLQALY